MALQDQALAIQFRGGVETKSDAKSVIAAKLLVLENGSFQAPGSIRKRNGFGKALSRNVVGSATPVSVGQGLLVFRGELILADGASVYSYDSPLDSWVRKGSFVSAYVTQKSIVRNTYAQTAQDSATHPTGLQCFAWEDSQGGVRYSVVDSSTGLAIVNDALVDASGSRPKCLALGNYLLVFWVNGTSLYYAPIVIATPQTLGSPVLVTNALSGASYDAEVIGQRIFVAWATATGFSALYYGSTLAASASVPVAVTTPTAMAVFADSFNQNAAIGWYDGTRVRFTVYDYGIANVVAAPVAPTLNSAIPAASGGSLATATYYYKITALGLSGESIGSNELSAAVTGPSGKVTLSWAAVPGAVGYRVYRGTAAGAENVYYAPGAVTSYADIGAASTNGSPPTMDPTTVETLANVTSVTGAAIPGASSSLRFFYSVSAASPSNYLTRTATVVGYGAATPAAYLRSVALAGKALVYNGTAYAPLAYQSTLQSTYFLADSAGNIVAKILAQLGGGIPARSVLPESNWLGGTRWQFSFLAKDLLTVTGGAVATLTGVSSATLDFFDPAESYARAELGGGLHVGGGFLSLYDGAGVVEHGFHLYPEGVTTALHDADAGSTQVYQYVAVYSWTDNQGQIHRSAPSPAVTQAKATAIDVTHRVDVTIPTLRLTSKQSPRRKVALEVYRTTANNPVFYLVTSMTSPTYNDLTTDTVAIVDSTTDATLLGNLPLYTTGEVENVAPGPISSIAIHQNRIVALSSENPLELWWSKQVVPGSPVEFSDLFVQNVDPVGGDVTAIARMDAWLVIFKREAIFVTNEDGPAANGGGYVFSSGQQVPSNVGCINPRSVNLNQNGLTFQSAKGWHLLTRGLAVQNIADAAAWKGETATSALTMPGTHESRFTLASGIALVNDDFVDQWGIFTNVAAVDSVIWQGVQVYLRADGQVRQETPGVFNDAGAPIKLRIKTSWLQFAGVSGFQRVRKLIVLGDFISSHTLVASIAYDFNSEPSQVSTIDATGVLGQPVYGGDSVYGGAVAASDSLVYGGTFPAYSWRISLAQQKCSALQITLEDSQTSPVGEGCSFAALTLAAAVKPGVRRVPAVRSA